MNIGSCACGASCIDRSDPCTYLAASTSLTSANTATAVDTVISAITDALAAGVPLRASSLVFIPWPIHGPSRGFSAPAGAPARELPAPVSAVSSVAGPR